MSHRLNQSDHAGLRNKQAILDSSTSSQIESPSFEGLNQSPEQPPLTKSNQQPATSNRRSLQTLKDLATYGPAAGAKQVVSIKDAVDYCQKFARSHYENFTVVTYLYPTRYRNHLANLYTFCRWSDDLADEIGDPQESLRWLDWWEDLLREGLQRPSSHPAIRGVVHTLRTFDIPERNLFDLISAFRQDQSKTHYANDEEVRNYCKGSANPVGRILLAMAKSHNDTTLPLSDSICTGLQIANFCQDISEDAKNGRIYMPRTRWESLGILDSDFVHGREDSKLKNALADWVHDARSHLIDGATLVNFVPLWLARNLQMFIRGGIAITDAIAESNYDVWQKDVKVSELAKLKILSRGLFWPRSTSFPLMRSVYRQVS